MTLDFLIIGAQKSRTTTLHEVMIDHPGIRLPSLKEAMFFTDEERYRAGWPAHFKAFYSAPDTEAKVGKASPQYLIEPKVAARIKAHNPDIRLIVILRNPIDRAFSHFRMNLRRNLVTQNFSEFVRSALQSDVLAADRLRPAIGTESEARCALVWSEYARQLAPYRAAFSRDQILVLFTEHLSRAPEHVFPAIFSFIGVDPEWTSNKMGRAFHKGGVTSRLAWARPLKKIPGVDTAYSAAIQALPQDLRWKFVNQWKVKPSDDNIRRSHPELVQPLVAHFAPDVERLARAWSVFPPWPEFGSIPGVAAPSQALTA